MLQREMLEAGGIKGLWGRSIRGAVALACVTLTFGHSLALGRSAGLGDLGEEVAAVLAEHCAACHSTTSNSFQGIEYRGEFDSALDLYRLRSSSFVDLESPEESDLYFLASEGEMPPSDVVYSGHARPLTTEEAGVILAWIQAGAPVQSSAKGERAFFDSCTTCHAASRALGKQKDLSSWSRTVARMAEKPGARVDSADVDAIAAYLTQASADRAREEGWVAPLADGLFENLEVHGVLSAIWRDSGRDERLESPDFTAEVWVGLEWHSRESPISFSVTACTTCHLSSEPEGRPIELVEASFRVDLDQALGVREPPLQAAVEAGRFVVPFGAFAARSNPAAYSTVSRPLMYNMGQGVNRSLIGEPLLPMPYSDEGVLVNLEVPLFGEFAAGLDLYAVNGLQGTLGLDLHQSRSWSDNNGDPAVGGRLSVGSPSLSIGASAMTGNMEAAAGALAGRLGYQIVGMDVSARIGRRLQLVAEVARRQSDQLEIPSFDRVEAKVEGYLLEADYLLSMDLGLTLVTRLDFLRHADGVAPFGSSMNPNNRVTRLTWGFDIATWGGTNLMINHEHWSMPDDLEDVDVIGARWVASF
jgi:mono/diheme cytochrome c family protein